MKKRTKRQLNVIFGLGLVTALLSIGRAATLTKKALTEDTTCKSHFHSIAIPLAHIPTREHGPIILLDNVRRQAWNHFRMCSSIAAILGVSNSNTYLLAFEVPTVSESRLREDALSDQLARHLLVPQGSFSRRQSIRSNANIPQQVPTAVKR